MVNNTTVHLLRHALVHNPTKIIYGRLGGFHLSEVGFEMANQIASNECIKENDLNEVSKIYSSPLLRAVQTATPISKKLDLKINTDNRLTESDSYFAGKRITFGTLSKAAIKNYLKDPALPSWGEPHRWVQNRILDIINECVEKHKGKSVLLVSHQLPIWLARLYFEKKKVRFFNATFRQCSLASITSLKFDKDGNFVSLKYSEPAAHLLKK